MRRVVHLRATARSCTLSGQITARTSSSRISAAVPGSEARPSVAQPREVLARAAGRASPRPARPRARRTRGRAARAARSLIASHDRGVVVAGERRVDPALEADLGRAALPGLARAADDLLVRDEVRRAAQVRRQLALREGAEAAAEVADVRVLDVPRDDVGDLVAADLAAEPVGGGEDALRARRRARGRGARARPRRARRRVSTGQRVARDDERDRARLARRPAVLAREPDRVRGAQRGGSTAGSSHSAREVARVDGQPRRELEPARARRGAQAARARATAPPG